MSSPGHQIGINFQELPFEEAGQKYGSYIQDTQLCIHTAVGMFGDWMKI